MKQSISLLMIAFLLAGSIVCSQQVYFNNRYQFNMPQGWSTSDGSLEIDDGYIITGATVDTTDFWMRWIPLVKLTKTGDTSWIKYIGNYESDYYTGQPGLYRDDPGNGYITGSVVKYDPYHIYGFVMKLDENWDTLWSKKYIGDETMPYDSNYSFNQMDFCENYDMVFTGGIFPVSKIVLFRTDSLGNEKWVKYFGTTGISTGYSVIQTTDGGFAIGGFWYEPGSIYQTGDPIVIKTDSLGNKEWEKNLGGPFKDNKAMLCKGTDGRIIAGTMYADSISGGDPYSRIHIVKMDIDGTIIWNRKYGDSKVKYNYLTNIRCHDDGSIIACGSRSNNPPHKSGWIMKVNSDGDSLWHRYYDNLHAWGSKNYLYDVIPTSDNGFLACGYVFPMPPDTGTQDAWVIKLDSMGCDTPGCSTGVGIENPSSPVPRTPYLHIFPNPASTAIHCRLQIADCRSLLLIFDMFGRKQEEMLIPKGQKEVRIDVSVYPAGIYVAVLKNDKGVTGQRKFVVR